MKFKSTRSVITRNLLNIPGWRTNRKILVIESDDWGSVRMPSKAVYNKLLNVGINVSGNPFNRFDNLAGESDYQALYEVLSGFKDLNNNPPIITTNFVVANPDFDKIRQSGFKIYHYELFTETLKKYPNHINSFALINQGINYKFLKPQFHGREHLNVKNWMEILQNNSAVYHNAFNLGVFGIDNNKSSAKRTNLMAAFDFDTESEKEYIEEITNDGINQFEKIFGYKPISLMAPCNVWHKEQENLWSKKGIKFIQGLIIQNEPQIKKTLYKKKYHYQGQRNHIGQRYLVRNCFFEPSTIEHYDWIGECLDRIRVAFVWKKPAIISMHRLNFIGSIEEKNRTLNLEKFNQLLKEILKRWPEIEFMSSDELGDLMIKNQ